MSDSTIVYFTALKHGIKVSSVLADFDIFGKNIVIHWYGVIIAFGFILAALLGGRIAYTWKMNLNKMVDVLIYGSLAGIVGARLYYVFSRWEYYSAHISEIPKIWEGGLAIYGGLIAGVIAAYIVARAEKLNFLNLLDCCGISFLVGQGIGRWGNFVNQEAFGTNTSLPWGMKSAKTVQYLTMNYDEITAKGIIINPDLPVHPTFLYESLWCLLGVFVLWLICRKFRKFSGQMILWYGVWYGTERAVVEGLRTDSLYIAGTNLRTSQVLSALIAVVCLALLIYFTLKYKKNPKPVEGIDYFIVGKERVSKEEYIKLKVKEKEDKNTSVNGESNNTADSEAETDSTAEESEAGDSGDIESENKDSEEIKDSEETEEKE